MPKVRIRGLVKVADTVRRELSQPVSTARKEQLRRLVVDSVQEVNRILARHGTRPHALPAPTRRAYQFLTSVNFEGITPESIAGTKPAARGNVSLAGLKSFWERVLDQLTQAIAGDRAGDLYRSIRSTSENIERYMEAEGLRAGDLTTQSRAGRGWLAFFCDRENFDAYLAAVRRATPILERSMRATKTFRTPPLVRFRPTPDLYRIRGYNNATRVVLPTPMICFSDEPLCALAEAAFNGGSKQAILEAAASDEYQGIQAELEALSGVEEWSGGVHRDLKRSFERVRATYFGHDLVRPRLTWSGSLAGRTFGHYDPIRDTVMINGTLDQADLPEYVLDFVMYHELLHKELGVGWRNGRRAMHTPQFRKQERRFQQYKQAESTLARLASAR
jgi:hypothetical protein